MTCVVLFGLWVLSQIRDIVAVADDDAIGTTTDTVIPTATNTKIIANIIWSEAFLIFNIVHILLAFVLIVLWNACMYNQNLY